VLPGFTRAADVGLAPVRILNEAERRGLSNKLFEYLHAGLPVVTSAGTAQAEIVEGDGAGEAIPDLEPATIAAAARRLGEAPDAERRARSERLRARAREAWSWEAESRVLTDIYARLAVPSR
jgi:glycosyltransferase involved in cell wall biosynthesis